MEKKNKKTWILISVIILVVIATVAVVLFILNRGHRVIKVQSFEGTVSLERGSSKKDILVGMNLKSEDTVTTGNDGLIELLVDEDKHIVAEADTCFMITSSGNEKKGRLKIELLYGTSLIEIDNKLPDGSSVEVKTPNATLSVRGTTFETTYKDAEDTTILKVKEGVVNVAVGKKTEDVEAGNMATIKDDEIVITALPFEYNPDILAFKLDYPSDNPIFVTFVKELVGWNYKITEENAPYNNGDGPFIFEKDGVKIQYSLYSEDEVDMIIDNHDAAGDIKALEYKRNDDGDMVICASYEFDENEGNVAFAYEYFKDYYDGIYISIKVYDEDGGLSLGDAEIDTYLPLTNECYYGYGEN